MKVISGMAYAFAVEPFPNKNANSPANNVQSHRLSNDTFIGNSVVGAA